MRSCTRERRIETTYPAGSPEQNAPPKSDIRGRTLLTSSGPRLVLAARSSSSPYPLVHPLLPNFRSTVRRTTGAREGGGKGARSTSRHRGRRLATAGAGSPRPPLRPRGEGEASQVRGGGGGGGEVTGRGGGRRDERNGDDTGTAPRGETRRPPRPTPLHPRWCEGEGVT